MPTPSVIPGLDYILALLRALETALTGKVSKSGDTMTGPLILSGDATQPFQAATYQQVLGVEGNATVAVFGGPERTISNRLVTRTLGDTAYPTGPGENDADWINDAIFDASDSWTPGSAPVKLFLENRELNIGKKTIIGQSNVEVIGTGATITHERLNNGSANTIALRATDVENFSFYGAKFIGPGSFMNGSNIVFSSTYAFQLTRCTNSYFKNTYENGNSGLLMNACANTNGFIEFKNLSGPALAVKGAGTSGCIVGARGPNSAGFGIYIAEEASGGVLVDYTIKDFDEASITEGETPYLYEELELAFKHPWNTILDASWSSTGGGRTTFTVSRNPTITTPATDTVGPIPPLVVGTYVRVSGVSSSGGTGVGFNGDFLIYALTSTTVVVVQAAASSPGTYTSGGIMGDMNTAQNCLGEEALGCTQSTQNITCNYLYSRRSGDAACSITGSYITLKVAYGVENYLNTVSSYGTGNQILYAKGEADGHWTSAAALYGGITVNFLSGAGTVARDSQCLKAVGLNQLKAVAQFDNERRFVFWSPNAEARVPYMVYQDEPDDINDIFISSYTSSPINPGARSPTVLGPTDPEASVNISSITWSNERATVTTATPHGWLVSTPTRSVILSLTISGASVSAYNGQWECRVATSSTVTFDLVTNPGTSGAAGTIGWVRPDSSLPFSYTSDGVTVWRYESSYVPEGGSDTVYPVDCQILNWSQRGTTPQGVIDLAGAGLGNSYPPEGNLYYNGAVTLLNAAYTWWINDITLSGTAQQFAPGWFGGRSVGGATITRVAGHETAYAARIQRTPGNASDTSLYWGTTITGAELAPLIGKRLQIDFYANAGADWNDTNDSMSITIYYSSVVSPLTSICAPSIDSNLLETQAILVDQNSYGKTFVTDNVIPSCAMLVIRPFYTPDTTPAGANDYLDFGNAVAGPYGEGRLVFEDQALEVKQLRLGMSASPPALPLGRASNILIPTTFTPPSSSTQVTVSDAEIRFFPIWLGNRPIASLRLEVITGVPSAVAWMSVYNCNTAILNGVQQYAPNRLVADFGEVQLSTTGEKTFTYQDGDEWAPQFPGWYFIALQCTNSPVLRNSEAGRNILGTSSATSTATRGLRTNGESYGPPPSFAGDTRLTNTCPYVWAVTA